MSGCDVVDRLLLVVGGLQWRRWRDCRAVGEVEGADLIIVGGYAMSLESDGQSPRRRHPWRMKITFEQPGYLSVFFL